jgi:teichuronic acid biosynthesis glycosyltransferase TuaC
LKVTVVTPYFPVEGEPHRGQSAFQTLLRLQELVELDVIVPLATYPRWLEPRNFAYSRRRVSFRPDGIKTVYFEYPAIPVLSRPVNGEICASMLGPLVRKARPDVILNYWIYPEGYAAARVGRKLRVPVILGALGSDINRLPDAITRHLTRLALHWASHVITVSSHLREQIIRYGVPPARVTAILNGCDARLFRPRPSVEARAALGIQQSPVVLYVGRLDLNKGLRELLLAAQLLKPKYPRILVLIAGGGPANELLKSQISCLGLQNHAILLGTKTANEVALLMAAADVFTLPSYAEGCPNVVVEAHCSGRPVVASNVGGIPELINSENGILVRSHDAQDLARGLDEGISGRWNAEKIAGSSSRSWSVVANETYLLCERVVQTQEWRTNKSGDLNSR